MRQPRAGNVDRAIVAGAREPVDHGPARIPEAEQLRHLVVRLPGRIVTGAAEKLVGPRRPDSDTGSCARPRRRARWPAAAARRSGGRATRCGRPGDGPPRAEDRSDAASAFANDTPTSSDPTRPGPCVTAIAPSSPGLACASPSARSTTPQMSRTCWREASSGTTPPHSRWISTCDATTFERIAHGRAASPVSSTTAAAVSSQEVSMPRMSMLKFGGRAAVRLDRLPQRLGVRRAADAALGDDAGDEAMRRHVERRIPDPRAVGGELRRRRRASPRARCAPRSGCAVRPAVARSIVDSGAAT